MIENLQKLNEFELAFLHQNALKQENFEVCAKIQQEVNARIESGSIDITMMDGFRCYDARADKFCGEPKYNGLNGLFNKYKSLK